MLQKYEQLTTDVDNFYTLIESTFYKQLLYSIDYLGRKINNVEKGFVIDVYDNGLVQKKYKLN